MTQPGREKVYLFPEGTGVFALSVGQKGKY
jgi:hypothetical protein